MNKVDLSTYDYHTANMLPRVVGCRVLINIVLNTLRYRCKEGSWSLDLKDFSVYGECHAKNIPEGVKEVMSVLLPLYNYLKTETPSHAALPLDEPWVNATEYTVRNVADLLTLNKEFKDRADETFGLSKVLPNMFGGNVEDTCDVLGGELSYFLYCGQKRMEKPPALLTW